MSRLEVAEDRSGRIGDKQMPATKWRDRVAIERREPAGTITCRPVGLLGVLTGRQVYAWAVRDAQASVRSTRLWHKQSTGRRPVGLYIQQLYNRPTPHLTSRSGRARGASLMITVVNKAAHPLVRTLCAAGELHARHHTGLRRPMRTCTHTPPASCARALRACNAPLQLTWHKHAHGVPA